MCKAISRSFLPLATLLWLASVRFSEAAAPAAPPTSAPGPRLSDEQFFALLDLSRPDLAAVSAAVAKADWPGARHALAEHMRQRTTPRWEVDPRAVGREPEHREPEAEQVLAHRLTSLGIDWQFGPTIDWAFNPTTQPGSKWARNHEWTWQLNHHNSWLALARAFYATGDERYAREFVAQLKGWMRDCPVPLAAVQNGPFSRWRTIEAGIRAGTVWPQIFPRFLAAKAFDDDALVLMLKGFVDHAEYLLQYHTVGNWLTMEANGLYHVGALFPEFKSAKLWRETAAERLDHELDAQVYPDGAQIELAPGYHGVTIHNFLGPVQLELPTGFAPLSDYLPKMEKMFAYLLYSMQPDRRTPPLNDSGAVDVVPFLQEGARLFPARQDFRWAATDGQEGRAPDHTSHQFPFAGQFILRSGWDRNALWLCMDGGPFGFGHQHEDKLSVILTAFGRPLLVEGGVYTYDASEWRRYVLSSRAHNVVLVDGLEQNRRHEPRSTYVVKTPLPHVWESNDTFDHAAARYDEGWGPDAVRLARQTRHVFFLKPDLFIIADELESLDGAAHSYEALFHLDAPEVKMTGMRLVTLEPGPTLALAAFGPDGVKVVKGQKEPEVQGWLPDRSAGYGAVKPIPTVIYRKTASGKVTLLYALYPAKEPTACPVTDARWSGDTLTVRRQAGPEQTVHFSRLGL